MSERSLGGYQSPVLIPDDLQPTAPAPSEGRQGPPISEELQPGYLELRASIDELGRRLLLETRPDQVSAPFAGTLDANGDAYIGLYQVTEGYEARMTRLVANSLVLASGLPYSPASPFSNASAYLELLTASQPQGDSVGNDGLLDFAPAVAAARLFPTVLSWPVTQAPVVRGPNWFVLHVVAGPHVANKPGVVFGRYQINLSRQKGLV